MMPEWLGALGGILLVDLALSGDNALVIGAAAAGLPPGQRRMAILAGGGGAIVLRVAFAALATVLLRLPLLQALGGVLLLLIAARLLLARGKHATDTPAADLPSTDNSRSLVGALLTILVADVTMSLDNILAVGALAAGNLPVLAVGLALSVALLLVASTIVAALIQRLPVLLDAAALVLGWTGGTMLLHDARVAPLFGALPEGMTFIVPLAATLLILVVDLLLRWRAASATRRRRATADVSA